MMPNFLVIGACALIPFVIAFIWFHPKVFGGETWNKLAGIPDEKSKYPVKPIQLLLSIVLNFLLAMGVFITTVHQTHVLSLTGIDVAAFEGGTALAFMQEYGGNFTTMGHGFTHGLFIAFLFFVAPILGYAVIFERKTFKYFLVSGSFWALSLTLMAVIISKWGGVPVY